MSLGVHLNYKAQSLIEYAKVAAIV
jgi:hypothetical protein